MNRLVDTGNTVIVIEHNLDIIKNADWIIDMGPEGGSKGGKVIFEGTPQQLLNANQSLTSAYLNN
jgi:excinuclease UvrABC ATPase subunit